MTVVHSFRIIVKVKEFNLYLICPICQIRFHQSDIVLKILEILSGFSAKRLTSPNFTNLKITFDSAHFES